MSFGKTEVAIFSFNRGPHLKNCVESVLTCFANCGIAIYDDHSTCVTTIEVLDWCRSRGVRVVVASGENSPRGGLYSNMNKALALAAAESADYVFFLQDDMQFVRPVTEADMADWCRLLRAKGICQVIPVFIKESYDLIDRKYEIDRSVNAYTKRGSVTIRGIADVGFCSIKSLHSAQWVFENSEKKNSDRAVALGWRAVVPKDPCVAFTPWPCRRSDDSRLIHRWMEKIVRSGVFPLDYFDDGRTERLNQRPIEDWPAASRWLTVAQKGLPEFVRYGPITLKGTLARSLRQLQQTIRKRRI